jgi:hypothetical protein
MPRLSPEESPHPQPLRGATIGFADIISGAERGSRLTISPLPRKGEGLGEGAGFPAWLGAGI